MNQLDFRALWHRALTYADFVGQSHEHCALWTGVHRLARIPAWAVERACARGTQVRLLVLAEDWCGDASSTIPYVARLAEQAPCLEMRMLRRDEHPEVMDRYLTGTSRAIPIVMVLDEDWEEIGHWGPRPRELHAWVQEARRTAPQQPLYPQMRRWYARDKGESALQEILSLLPSDRRVPVRR
jgi:thioredoxin family protein